MVNPGGRKSEKYAIAIVIPVVRLNLVEFMQPIILVVGSALHPRPQNFNFLHFEF